MFETEKMFRVFYSSAKRGSRACGWGGALAVLLALAAPALADWDAKLFNPQAAKDDVVLPMPCGGAMAFRRVAIPAEGALGDRAVTLGSAAAERGYAEGPRRTWVAGSLPGGKTTSEYWIGKYEVSELQYKAVMEETCPTANLGGRLAKGGVSWFDAVAFSERYTTWLLKTAAKSLPKNGDEPGFVRLPTEDEWEFAARGGAAVADADFSEPAFPMPEGMARYVWFAGTQSANGKPQLTGLLKPNPLGVYDILGNLDEIAFAPFHLNKLGRAHGAAGGFVVRGGNYLTAESDIRAAARAEVPYFDAAGPRRAKTTGFRVVVSAPVIGAAAQLQAARAAWEKLGASSAPEASPQAALGKRAADPVAELEQIAKAAPTPEMKARLEQLRSDLRANIAARDEQRDRAAKTALRMGAFLGRKLKDDGLAIDTLAKLAEAQKARDPNSERTRDYLAALQADQAAMDDNLRYYADTVIRTAEDYGEDTLTRQRELLTTELKGIGLGELAPFVALHLEHVLTYRKDMRVSRAKWLNDWKTLH
ncbi:conserved exported hypothetical protein [uncultured Alphaproteobacteria bacterium]|uniref:Sulfatase-modifying factor enzyme-like domain-containing protein n=1 Tax=uncultured Alphaproteobacteria bacterium TaxID=91750 RepID=A0A212IW49_9PROT|nr:conserved exported hypothetical protein [uncultured Alphaproteobacteria bacterium]